MMAASTGKIGRGQSVTGSWSAGKCKGNLGRNHRLNVGRFRASSCRCQVASRPRRGRECEIGICAVGLRARFRRNHAGSCQTRAAARRSSPSGLLTPLMFAAREDDMESTRLLVAVKSRCKRDPVVTGKTRWASPGLQRQLRRRVLPDRQPFESEPGRCWFLPLFWAVKPQYGSSTGTC